jgi:hypothetical protein
MGSGFLPIHEGTQPPAPELTNHRASLPERYGIPLLELLVVDAHFIFISWEVTTAQLDQARQLFGDAFDIRRLQVTLTDSETGTPLGQRELYGDIGRWFIQLSQPGIWLRATLHFRHLELEMQLGEAGPVFIPRDTPLEPERWEELLVTYARSEKGELRLDSIEPGTSAQPRLSGLRVEQSEYGDAERGPGYRHIETALLRPLLPLAPASVEDRDD